MKRSEVSFLKSRRGGLVSSAIYDVQSYLHPLSICEHCFQHRIRVLFSMTFYMRAMLIFSLVYFRLGKVTRSGNCGFPQLFVALFVITCTYIARKIVSTSNLK